MVFSLFQFLIPLFGSVPDLIYIFFFTLFCHHACYIYMSCHWLSSCWLVGLVIEEITEEDEVLSSTSHQNPSVEEHSEKQLEETKNDDKSQKSSSRVGSLSNSECLQALKDDPDAIRYFIIFLKVLLLYFIFTQGPTGHWT